MTTDGPVIIFATPRARSSMIAAIFAEHGFKHGPVGITRAGYVGYESVALKNYLKEQYGRAPDVGDDGTPFFAPPADGDKRLAALIEREQREHGTPFFFKCGIFYRKLFDGIAGRCVYIRRDVEGCLTSYVSKAHKNLDPLANVERARRVIGKRFAVMERLAEQENAPLIDTDAVRAGDYTSTDAALRYCGAEPDLAAYERAIK